MIYKAKFNLFSGSHQYNKEITINANSYDDARKKLLSRYPGALYIVIDAPDPFLWNTGNSPDSYINYTNTHGNSLLSDNYKNSTTNITIGNYGNKK